MANKMVPIIVGVVVVVGAVIGLGVAGIVPIPGLTHAKVKKPSKKDEADAAAKKKADEDAAKADDAAKAAAADKKRKEDEKLAKDAKAKADEAAREVALAEGYKKLASVWGNMKPNKLVDVLKAHYKPEMAAPILQKMDESQVAEILALMDPKEAAAYSDSLAKEAGKPPATAPSG